MCVHWVNVGMWRSEDNFVEWFSFVWVHLIEFTLSDLVVGALTHRAILQTIILFVFVWDKGLIVNCTGLELK